MKHFKKFWTLLLLITTVGCFADENDENYQPEPSIFADPQEGQIFENKELEKDVRTHQLAEQPATPKFEARTTSKPGFFDKISNWSNKRTLRKAFADHAKNSATDENVFSNKNNEAMWKSLSKEDQKDLVNEWFKTHETKRQQELQKDRKNYESSSKDYESGTKKRTLARIDNSYKEIKNLQSKIDKLEAERNFTTNPSKKRNDLNAEIDGLENKKETENENIKGNLTLIAKELDSDDKEYKATHMATVKNQIDKIKHFINSINDNEFSKIKAELLKESNQAPATKITTQRELTKEEELEKLLHDTSDRIMTPKEFQRMTYLKEQLFGNTEETPASLATKEAEIKSLSDQQIRNLSNDQLLNLMNEFENKDSKYYNNPEYQKLNTENNRRNEPATQKKAKESVFDTLGLNPKEFAKLNTSETSTPASTKLTEDLEGLKRKAQNWSLPRIKEEMLDSKYSKAELEYLKAEAKLLEQ